MELPAFIRTRTGVVCFHVFAWMIFYIRDIYKYIVEPFDAQELALDLSYNGLTISTFYIFFYWIWPKILRPGKYLRIIPGIIVGLTFFIGGRYLIQEILFPIFLGFRNYLNNPGFFFYVDDNFFRAFKMIAYSLVIYLFIEKIALEKQEKRESEAKSEAELSFLRSQINPHFLFNMLNYLHAEAYVKDENLADSILQLSDLLRYSTQKSNKKGALLQDEIYHLKNYIELYKKRFGVNCFVEYQQTGTAIGQRVEPLMFIPFVENAFKHGVYTDVSNPINIELSVDLARVQFSCNNLVSKSQKDAGSGIGLENVRQRLELLYPNRHVLSVQQIDGIFKVELSIDLL